MATKGISLKRMPYIREGNCWSATLNVKNLWPDHWFDTVSKYIWSQTSPYSIPFEKILSTFLFWCLFDSETHGGIVIEKLPLIGREIDIILKPLCDGCEEDANEATKYCVDCGKMMCDQCLKVQESVMGI